MSTRTPERHYGFFSVPWREYIGGGKGWVADASFGQDGASVVTVVDTPWATYDTWIAEFLGYSVRGNGGTLERHLPAQHSRFGWLRGNRVVRVEGVGPLGKDTNNANGTTAVYEIARLTCSWAPRPYKLAEGGNVWESYTTYQQQPSTEYLSREKGNMIWMEGPRASPPRPTPSTFFGPGGILVCKKRATWVTHELPHDYVFDASGNTPQIDAALGCVNAVEFAGYPAGTLLMESAVLEPYPMPIDITGRFKQNFPAVYYRLTVMMIHYRPNLGAGATTEGWNTDYDPETGLAARTGWVGNTARGKFPVYQFQNIYSAA